MTEAISLADAIAALRYYRSFVNGNPPREAALVAAERVLTELQVRQDAMMDALKAAHG